MRACEYQKLAMRTNDDKSTYRLARFVNEYMAGSIDGYDFGGIINGVLGLTGEAGEFSDMIKKWMFHDTPLDIEHAQKELGDVLWYVALICESFDWSMEEIMSLNIDKLMKRYPDGFDTTLANNRNEGDV